MFGPARFFAPYAYVIFDFWEEYVEISLLDDLGGEVKRSGEMSVVITTHCGSVAVVDGRGVVASSSV